MKDFNQGSDMIGFEFLTVYWLKGMEPDWKAAEEKW